MDTIIAKDKMDFRVSEGLYIDYWRGHAQRHYRYVGKCAYCGIRMYAFDDGENDPRGPIGEHANSDMIANDYNCTGPDVKACWMCGNDEYRYLRLLEIAQKQWKDTNGNNPVLTTRQDINKALEYACRR